MKKVFYLFTMVLFLTLIGCNGAENNENASTSANNSASAVSVSTSGVETEQPSAVTQPSGSTTNAAPATAQPTKKPLTPEEAEKYKEAISLLKDYGKEMINCLDAKKSGKEIDDDTKQRISQIQNKLTELQKAGKMNQDHIELFKANNDMYNQLTAK